MKISHKKGNITIKALMLFSLSFVLIILPISIACGSRPLPAMELPYGQSAALFASETGEASRLPDITHYDLKLSIDMENSRYTGNAMIDYTNLEDTALPSIFLRLTPNGGGTYGSGRLDIQDLTVNGSEAETVYSLSDSVVEILLESQLDPGGHLAMRFDFEGSVPVDFAGDGYGIFSLADGVMNLAGWYPIVAVYDDQGWNIDPVSSIGDAIYSDTAYYTVELTIPGNMKHSATGVMIQEVQEEGSNRYKYVSGPVRDFFITVSSQFEVKSRKIDDIMVNVHYLPGQEWQADMTLDIAKGSLETFNDKFGRYPYKEFDIIDSPMNGSVAVEFPGIVVVGSQVFGNPVFTAHEIAHQWWYSLVGNDVIDDPWLDEALTTYSSILYYEFTRSGIEYGQVLDYFMDEHGKTLSSGEDDVVTEGLDYFEELGGKHYSRIVYTKGALFYHELRQEIGDRAFFNALKDYYSDLKYGIASSQDILDRFEEFSGRQLDSFYQEWLY